MRPHLSHNGLSILVLEARDRIGGRAWTSGPRARAWTWGAAGCTRPTTMSWPGGSRPRG
ncbi:FAD-dependent oxidoreductase [Brevundimonas intermedia]|uniref:FAD-dependent oxidoreductase n=1 Tax=Brevundimonas intermedia TaxID=74315 RepID=UPI001FD75411|nr:FAD-dependent oxidoreductase [Brevundimonas intermedia]